MGLIGRITSSAVVDGIREIATEIYTNFTKKSKQILPPCIDANPLPEDQGVSIFIDGNGGKTIQIGVYPDPKAEPGEVRFYSRNGDGEIQALLWLKKDGKININGTADNAVRYSELKAGFDQLKADYNDLESKWSTFANAYVAGGPAVQGTPPTAAAGAQSTASVDNSKVEEVTLS